MSSTHPFGWSSWSRSRWWQLVFFLRGEEWVGGERSARDLKSDTDSKSAEPVLLCEASCSGLILSESMCGGLRLWHTSRDSERLPWVLVLLLPLLMSIRVNLSWRKKGNKKTRCYCWAKPVITFLRIRWFNMMPDREVAYNQYLPTFSTFAWNCSQRLLISQDSPQVLLSSD